MQPICYNLDLGTRTTMVERCQGKDLNVGDVENGDIGKEILCAKHHLASGIQVPLKNLEKRQWRKGTRLLSHPLVEEKEEIDQ